jgi:hypothetical protein
MQLIERYIQAVKFWLPESQQEDIASELHANILSQVEEQEAALSRSLHEEEEVAILKQLGPPAIVAARYQSDRRTLTVGRELIGPLVFPYYWLAVKVTLGIVAAIQLLSAAGSIVTDHKNVTQAIAQVAWQFVNAAFLPLLLVTAVFVAFNHARVDSRLVARWDPRSLPPLRTQTRDISRSTSIAGIIVEVIFIGWWLRLPNAPEIVFGALRPAPIWQTLYAPVLAIALVSLAKHVVTLFRPRWSWLPPVIGLATSVAGLVILYPLLEMQPLVSLASAEATAVAQMKVGKLNTTLHFAVIATWIGILIAALVEGVRCFRVARRFVFGGRSTPASRVVDGGAI